MEELSDDWTTHGWEEQSDKTEAGGQKFKRNRQAPTKTFKVQQISCGIEKRGLQVA